MSEQNHTYNYLELMAGVLSVYLGVKTAEVKTNTAQNLFIKIEYQSNSNTTPNELHLKKQETVTP